MSVSDTLINSLFDGRYRIVRKLGSGGMANVYLAEDEDLGRRVAIKILNARYADDELFVERFRREAKSAASLSHPNIVSIYDRGEAEGHPYIAMEVIEGRSLKELILSRGPVPVEKAITYAKQILSALRFAHRNGIIHRDIKPHNILVGVEDRLKVTDFGIARAGASEMTEVGSIMGTAQYLSPEQAGGSGSLVTAASDLYSAGVVLYEMLTGQVPFSGDTPFEIAMKHLNETPRPPSELEPGVPDELDQIVLRALAKDPADRYASADEFSDELDRCAAGLPISRETAEAATAVLAGASTAGATQVLATAPAAPPRAPAPPRRPPPHYGREEPPRRRRRSALPWLFVFGLLCAAAVAGWYVYTQIQDELREAEPVAVPNVVGIERRLAVDKIEEAELESEVREAPNAEAKAGVVFEQRPDAGQRIAKGERVTITVSTGVPRVEVPKLAGLTFNEALQRLSDLKLQAQRKEVFNNIRPEGEVVSQDPKPGKSVPEGSAVIVRVSKGKQTVAVPDVLGQDRESAEEELASAGFDVRVVTGPADAPEGTVFAQSPDPGVESARGSGVQISISEGPQTVSVPSVVGQDQNTAQDALEEAGFAVQVQQAETSDPTQDFIVQSQDPSGGVQVEPGSTVTIVVGVFVEPAPEEGGDGEVTG
jgi:serine/threonine-protein kinase